MSEFTSGLNALPKNTGISADTFARKVTIDFTRDLVVSTPVDTGHARSNWFFRNDRSGGIDTASDKSGSPSNRRCAAFTSGLRAGGVFFITNNLPYILELEYGSSKQAPGGMARVAVARFNSTFAKTLAGMNR